MGEKEYLSLGQARSRMPRQRNWQAPVSLRYGYSRCTSTAGPCNPQASWIENFQQEDDEETKIRYRDVSEAQEVVRK